MLKRKKKEISKNRGRTGGDVHPCQIQIQLEYDKHMTEFYVFNLSNLFPPKHCERQYNSFFLVLKIAGKSTLCYLYMNYMFASP